MAVLVLLLLVVVGSVVLLHIISGVSSLVDKVAMAFVLNALLFVHGIDVCVMAAKMRVLLHFMTRYMCTCISLIDCDFVVARTGCARSGPC